jgi:ketosteroid isomerase-like protein
MKRKRYLAMISVFLLGAVSFFLFSNHAPGKPPEEIIKANLTAMWAAIEAGDIKGYAKYLHPDFSAFGETDTYLAEGKDLEIRKTAAWLKRASGIHTEMHQPKVTVKGDVAWITYYWTDSGTENNKGFSSRGKSTRIFVKEKGRWLCIHGHYTLVK